MSAPQTIGVGMLGYAFMGKAHANACKTIAYRFPYGHTHKKQEEV